MIINLVKDGKTSLFKEIGMNYWDTHTHLQDISFGPDRGRVVENARKQGVLKLLCCATGPRDWEAVYQLALKYEGFLVPAFGVHPLYLEELVEGWEERLEGYLKKIPSAVGEIGLDFWVKDAEAEKQVEVFEKQLELAEKYERPVSVHCRKAWDALLKIWKEKGRKVKIVMHSYSGSADTLKILLKGEVFFSFSGAVTRPGHVKTVKALSAVPHDRILFETDSPDLIPWGCEGTRNEPGFLPLIVHSAASVLQMEEKELALRAFENAERVFHGCGI